jgi:putative hydrolase of the HAD superfamily
MLKQPFQSIKNIVFDIGDVLVDIDYNLTIAEFQKLAIVDFSTIVSYAKQERIFDLFEKGKISAQEFRDGLKKYLKSEVTDAQINAAWNSILIAYPKEKFELLLALKKQYRIFALSNINEIHVESINQAAQKLLGAEKFADFFHKAYYSNETGFRKPETEIYELVLQEQFLQPNETLFIDDKAENIEAAARLGIQTIHLTNRNELLNLFETQQKPNF